MICIILLFFKGKKMNASRFILLIGIISIKFIQISLASVLSTGDFNNDFFVTWSPSHVNTSANGQARTLKLDQESGSAFASNGMFLFGQFDMQIKLIPGYSAGTVLSSNQPNRDEIDFEFLGNVDVQPYILQTNVYVDGFDDREQRIKLWFDPTKDFHTYSILWDIHQIVFMVDWVPIRTYRNHADKGVSFPRWQPMALKVSIWDGDSWATRGGKAKIDWSKGPFIASFQNRKFAACVWKGNARFFRAGSPTNWRNQEVQDPSSSLTWVPRKLFRWVREYRLIYDYCQDSPRFQNNLPKECSLPKY